MEGTISLGIYDAGGRLVRVLHCEADESAFAVGLNGLITSWDGLDDSGKPAPKGRYAARGVVVGDLVVEGEAFHGNDWITDEASPRLVEIMAMHAKKDGTLVMLVKKVEGNSALVRCNMEGDIVWNQPLPEKVSDQFFAANDTAEFVVRGKEIVRLQIPSSEARTFEADSLSALAADDGGLVTIEGGKLRFRKPDSGEQVREETAGDDPPEVLAVSGERLVALRDGKVVEREDGAWRETALDSQSGAIDLSFGPSGSLWVVDRAGSEVKEYGPDGNFLRRLGIPKGEPKPQKVSASGEGDLLYLLERKEGEQRLRGLKLVASEKQEGPGAEAVSRWQVILSRSIFVSNRFEDVQPLLEGFQREKTIEVSPRENPLTPEKTERVKVRVQIRDGRSVLETADGLPLRTLSDSSGQKWAAIGRRESTKSLFVVQSDGAVVEEYRIRRVENLMQFDCGDFDFPEEATVAEEPPVPDEQPASEDAAPEDSEPLEGL